MQFVHTAATALAICLAVSSAIAQAPKPITTTPGSPPPGSGMPGYNNASTLPGSSISSKPSTDPARTIFVTGKVAFPDGREPVHQGGPHGDGGRVRERSGLTAVGESRAEFESPGARARIGDRNMQSLRHPRRIDRRGVDRYASFSRRIE